MPSLSVRQRVHYPFHPYQNKSLPPSTHPLPSTRCAEAPRSSPFTALPSSLPLSMETRNPNTSQGKFPVALKLSDSAPTSSRRAALPSDRGTIRSASGPSNESRSATTLATLSLPKLWVPRGSNSPHSLSSACDPNSPARAPARPQPIEDIVSYLKKWRPPVEYYARRRYHHPSLSYPSRQPSLPALLEERVTQDGVYGLVCPELAIPISPRVHHRKLYPGFFGQARPNLHRAVQQGWDDESDEEFDSEDSDEEDDLWSDTDSDEALTPGNSPVSTSTYFLQPLVLTKPPGC